MARELPNALAAVAPGGTSSVILHSPRQRPRVAVGDRDVGERSVKEVVNYDQSQAR